MMDFAVIIDLDGTLVHNDEAIEGAKELIDFLNVNGIPFRIITNSVGRTTVELSEKTKSLGIEINYNQFLNPITALDRYLKSNSIESYYFVGPSKIGDSLSIKASFDGIPEYVVLSGLESADYNLLNRIFGYVKQGAKILTMSRSEYFFTKEGPQLDTGAFTRMLEYHSDRKAILFGKPSFELFIAAIEDMSVDTSNVFVVGDDILTDIKGAKEFGLSSVLVRTGKYQKDDELKETPSLVVDNLKEIIEAIDADSSCLLVASP